MASKRTFGVELECGNPNLSYSEVADKLKKAKIPTYGQYGVGYDGSGIEVRTPVLEGKEGYEALRRMMNYLHELGCYVTRSDGMHVHVGAPELNEDEEACKVLARLWYHNQELIGKMVSRHRFGNAISGIYVCSKLNEKETEEWGQRQHNGVKHWGTRYKSLSLYRVPSRNTVEFRLHEGCLDPEKAIPWVKFCQGLVDFAISKRKVITCASKTALLKELAIPEDAASVLAKRQKVIPPHVKVYRA